MRLMAQLEAKNHTSCFAFLILSPQKSAIIELTGVAASFGTPEAIAVGWLCQFRTIV